MDPSPGIEASSCAKGFGLGLASAWALLMLILAGRRRFKASERRVHESAVQDIRDQAEQDRLDQETKKGYIQLLLGQIHNLVCTTRCTVHLRLWNPKGPECDQRGYLLDATGHWSIALVEFAPKAPRHPTVTAVIDLYLAAMETPDEAFLMTLHTCTGEQEQIQGLLPCLKHLDTLVKPYLL